MDQIIQCAGATLRLDDVLARLLCRIYVTVPTWLRLADGIQGTARAVRSVMLVGEPGR